MPKCPVSRQALQRWLEVRPELRLERKRPTVAELADRICRFWLPDEVIVYIGLAGTSLRSRVRQYYETPLGARRPHAGGHFLKALTNLSDLYVHWALTSDPQGAEDAMLAEFCRAVSEKTRTQLLDLERPFPFGNLEWPPGTRKRHGLTGTKGDLLASREFSVRSGPIRGQEASGPATGTKVTLHEEIARILRENGDSWMTTEELAAAVNAAANYKKKDRSLVTAFQIHGRTKNYPGVFERDGSRVRLRS